MGSAGLIRAIVFDLDNTLTDFMRMKEAGVEAAVDGMLEQRAAVDIGELLRAAVAP